MSSASTLKISETARAPHLEAYRRELFQLIRTLSFRQGDFVLASGQRSSYYLDCRMTTLHGRGSLLIGSLLYDLLAPLQVDAVGGVVIGAAPMVTAITTRSAEAGHPLNGFLIRKEAKGHGTGRGVEGHIAPWMRVALVEDVLTTGGSLLKGIEILRTTYPSLRIVQAVALVDRDAGGREALEKQSIPFRALYNVREFLQG